MQGCHTEHTLSRRGPCARARPRRCRCAFDGLSTCAHIQVATLGLLPRRHAQRNVGTRSHLLPFPMNHNCLNLGNCEGLEIAQLRYPLTVNHFCLLKDNKGHILTPFQPKWHDVPLMFGKVKFPRYSGPMSSRWTTRTKAFLKAQRSLLVWVPLALLIQSDVVTLMSVTGRSMSVCHVPLTPLHGTSHHRHTRA